jgi:Zn-dependent protease
MGWEDRPYYRDRGQSGGNPLMWLLTGSVPLFTAFGIRVRAHANLIVLIVLGLLAVAVQGASVQMTVQSLTILFLIILLHEFGHCFAARWTGGQADEIIMTPLGGLALAMARKRPWPTAVTVAGGPLVNVIICLVCGFGLFLTRGVWPLGPWQFNRLLDPNPAWFEFSSYLFWIYAISYGLLLFNLIPVFPLDGGQLLQAVLWKPLGYYKSMLMTMNIGLVGSVLMAMVGIASIGSFFGMLLLIIAINCFMNCMQYRQHLRAEGPWGFQEEDSVDYAASIYGSSSSSSSSTATRARRQSRLSKWSAARAKKRAQDEQDEQVKIDEILAKVSAHGMHSLSWSEKRALHKATERQRERDLETGRTRGGG